jgi:ribosomal protein L40E
MKCPSCGANNSDTAKWCSQCLRRFEPSEGGRPVSSVYSPAELPSGPAPDLRQSTTAAQGSPANAASHAANQSVLAGPTVSRPTLATEVASAGFALPSVGEGGKIEALEDSGAKALDAEEAPFAAPGVLSPHTGSRTTTSSASPTQSGLLREPDATTGPANGSLAPNLVSTQAPSRSEGAPTRATPTAVLAPLGQSARLASTALPHTVERDALGRLTLRCSRCGASNAVEATECSVCGHDFFAALRSQASSQVRQVSPNEALVWGLLPGGGYTRLGMNGRFVGHFLLVAWLVFLAFVVSPRELFLFRLVFALGAAGVWAGSAIDASRRAAGEEEPVLSGRRPLYVFMASLAVVFAMGLVLAVTYQRKSLGGSGNANGPVIEVPADQGPEAGSSGPSSSGGDFGGSDSAGMGSGSSGVS